MFRSPTRCRTLLLAALLTALPAVGWSEETPPTETVVSTDANLYVGQSVTICGPVAGTAYFPHLKGEPTYINFDRRYPEQSFTVVIWGDYRNNFAQSPEKLYKGKNLCVTGKIETYKGKPQIIVLNPEQIQIRDAGLVAEQFSFEERVLLKSMLAALGHEVDPGTGEWDPATEQAMRAFQTEQGIEAEGGENPKTLRALALAVERLPAGEDQKILRLFLLNLAQREETAARK